MKLSVIICTRNRSHAVVGCLESVVKAIDNTMPIEAEIVVVDNGSTDDTSATVTNFSETCAVPIKLVSEPRKGLALARNTGVKASKGDLLIFTDDDCRVAEDYFVAALRHNESDTELVLRSGRVEQGDPSDLRMTLKTENTLQRWNKQTHPKAIGMLNAAFTGANMMMRRALFDTLGGFDIRLGAGTPFHSAEDIDYAYRAHFKGMLIEYAPDMKVYHFHGRKTISSGEKLLFRYSTGLGALYAKHLLNDIRWLRPIYWHVRNALLDPLGGEAISPDFKFSHLDKLHGLLRGLFGFYASVIRSKIRS
jgi:glycosyltransferase involved in cell wall biosynthesis